MGKRKLSLEETPKADEGLREQAEKAISETECRIAENYNDKDFGFCNLIHITEDELVRLLMRFATSRPSSDEAINLSIKTIESLYEICDKEFDSGNVSRQFLLTLCKGAIDNLKTFLK